MALNMRCIYFTCTYTS